MKKKLFRTHAFITGIVLIGFICITIINYCTYGIVIRDDIRNISRLTSLNIFSSISNELTKPIFVFPDNGQRQLPQELAPGRE